MIPILTFHWEFLFELCALFTPVYFYIGDPRYIMLYNVNLILTLETTLVITKNLTQKVYILTKKKWLIHTTVFFFSFHNPHGK